MRSRPLDKGTLYVVDLGHKLDELYVVKIGVTKHLKQRLNVMATYAPFGVVVVAAWDVPSMKVAEEWMHRRYEEGKAAREWFRVDGRVMNRLRTGVVQKLLQQYLAKYEWVSRTRYDELVEQMKQQATRRTRPATTNIRIYNKTWQAKLLEERREADQMERGLREVAT